MRTTATCPKCSGKKIAVAALQVVIRGEWPSVESIPPVAFVAKGKGPQTVGGFESWICTACGYTEFYAKDLGDVDRLAAERSDDVRIVDATNPARGPFR